MTGAITRWFPAAMFRRPSARYGGKRLLFNGLFVRLAAITFILLASSVTARAQPVVILALGDSLTAGYGLRPAEAFPAQLERYLKARGHDVRVRNGGVSGDTAAGGRARLAWALADGADLVIVELGANDGLRGLPPAETRDNLDAILAELGKRGVAVLLSGMRAPPNRGAEYVRDFNGIFAPLAAKHEVAFYPFFLDGVAAQPGLNQHDGIHPNAKGVARIVERIAPHVERLLKQIGK